jgi:NAD-dependent SIR2 family protein deacetylase
MDLKCSSPTCDYHDKNNFTDPLCPILTITPNFSDPAAPSVIPPSLPPAISPADLPHCPKCQTALLRPGVVWFGEELPEDVLDEIDAWIEDSKHIDLMLVIGTSAVVWPAASYIAKARAKGAKVAVVNLDAAEMGIMGMLRARDWLFEGDAATIVPEIFKGVIGEDYPTGQGSTGA